MDRRSSKMWLPLESNPKVFTDFAGKLGYPTVMFGYHDVISLEEDVWAMMVPQPVIAVVLLYQIRKQHDDLIKKELES